MDKIEELLPGIEEFLTCTLASEPLSPFAEERRQFFIERLDIVKLPPTLPPREGRVLPPELLKETEENSGIPVTHSAPDFAATQREISRSLVDPNPYQDDETDGPDNVSEKNVKVYDDIDPADVGAKPDVKKPRPHSEIIIRPSQNSDEDNDDEDENDLYEIPVARQQLSAEDNSLSYGADGSSLATAGSTEELPDDVLESSTTTSSMGPPPIPPPLPPRRDIKFSDSGSKNSLNAEDKPPELPFRPPLPKRSELNPRSDKSDRSEKSINSDPDVSGDGDSTSYESFEEDNEHHDTEPMNKYDVQLPKKPKKKSSLKKSKKLSKSRSSSQWEISVPFRKLESIDISGELYHRGKLSWNRRIVAISNGCLAMYKPDKEARPMLVIPLTGYEATVTEREGRAKGFEVKMTHPNDDTHTFSVDFKEWANLWMEHINGTSKGLPPPKYHTHLARSFTGGAEIPGTNPATYGSKLVEGADNPTEIDYDEIEFGGRDLEDLFIKEECDDTESIKSSPATSTYYFSPKAKTLVARHFQSEKSPSHSTRSKTIGRRPNVLGLSPRDKTIGATVKDILRRRQKATYTFQHPEPCPEVVERYTLQTEKSEKEGKQPEGQRTSSGSDSQGKQAQCKGPHCCSTTPPPRPVSTLSLSNWGWKSFFYNWSLPLDQVIFALRGTDLTGSNSNVSTGSEGAGSEDNTKPKMRGNKVMRMGSFAFRATQFFENIGKKTTTKKKGSGQSSGHQNIRHSASGDYADVCNGIVEESSISSSNSTGNLTNKNVLTPTSDISYPSVFGNGSSSSLPTTPMTDLDSPLSLLHGQLGQGMEEDEDAFAGVAHRGYLSIFSSFNKRRWGKRWCMVRENMFECYRSERSKQCELNFLLKPCVFRRALAETNSELGLMIMEAGREKITVEPLSREEMGPWVRILLIETSTSPLPEGLEEFMKETKNADGDSSSVMSFSVLKQWDMGSLVPNKGSMVTSKSSSTSHDYEDPVETAAAAAKLYSSDSNTSSQVASGNSKEDESPDSAQAHSVINSEAESATQSGAEKFPRISENLVAYNKNKHTTDSGFYSVKGANSDSDSSCENSSRDVGELDCGYATLDSRNNQDSGETTSSSKSSSEERSSPSKDAVVVVNLAASSDNTNANGPTGQPHSASSSSSQCVQISRSSSSSSKSASFSSGSQKVVVEASESHSSLTVSMSKSEHSSTNANISTSSQKTAHHDSNSSSNTPSSSALPPHTLDFVKRHSSSTSTQKSVSSSLSSSNTTIISPSGEEYSIVLKRSERSSSKSPETESPASHNRTSGKLEDSVFEENENINGDDDNDDDDLNSFADELVGSMTSKNSDESYYEPIGQQNSSNDNMQGSSTQASGVEILVHETETQQQSQQQQPQTSSVIQTPSNLDANSSLDSEKLSCESPVSISGKLEHNASAVSSSGESSEHCDSGDAKPSIKRLQLPMTGKKNGDNDNNDCPPPIPTSPVPELMSSSKSSENLPGLSSSPSNKPTPALASSSPPDTDNSVHRDSNSNPGSADKTPLSSKGSKKKGKKPAPLKNADASGLSLPLCNGETGSSLSPHDPTSKSELPVTPTTDTVNAMVENPDTTVDELKEVIDRLKIKQSEIKRKRMAVHDKRQRVLSDEERLACEKEFAALERTGENTDLDIRVLQNQLDFLQGQTLEAMKAAQGKRKSGSRKKKKKKN